MSDETVKIFADFREVPSEIPTILEDLGAIVETPDMQVGDYHVSDKVVIERKTTSDFLHSIIDDRGHLFRQLGDMAREYKRQILIIEGEPIELYASRDIHPNAIDGMLLAVMRYRIPVMWSLSADHTARLIYSEARHEQINQKHTRGSPHGKRSHMPLPERQEYVVSAIGSGVGPVIAEVLLRHFGTVRAVMNASFGELCGVKGIQETIAQNIHDIIRSEYKK